MTLIALAIYATAMTVANLLVAAFGPGITPINAFVLIGLDLSLRDWLHYRLSPWQMGVLIAATGLLSYVLNPAAGRIAVASSVAFAVSALADWLAFRRLSGSWMRRANGSNIIGAAVDSALFPTLAFGAVMPWIVAGQFAAKVCGGVVWAWAINRASSRAATEE